MVLTLRSTLGTTGWPCNYGGRGIINDSFLEAENGHVTDEMRRKHDEALAKGDSGWGKNGRLTAYAGTGVGLVSQVMPAQQVVHEVRHHARRILHNQRSSLL